MSINIHPVNVFLYFDNHVCYWKAKRLHSLCVARYIRYVCSQTRRHLRLMSIVTMGNYLVSYRYFCDFFGKKRNGKSCTNYWNLSELEKVEQFCNFIEVVHKITKCKKSDCPIATYWNNFKNVVFGPILDYDVRRNFLLNFLWNLWSIFCNVWISEKR